VNVIIITTLEIPLTLLIGWAIFHEKSKWGVVLGAVIILVGVIVTALLHESVAKIVDVPLNRPLYRFLATTPWAGEACIFLAVIVKVISIFFSRYTIQSFSTGIFNIFRVGVGAFIFFWIVMALFGLDHFADLLSPFLWAWMVLYGGVIVALKIYLRYIGLRHAQASEIAISSAIIPITSIFFAYVILGDVPGTAQWIGGSITMFGILMALLSKLLEKEKVILQRPIGFTGN